jgi:hypothetical protein
MPDIDTQIREYFDTTSSPISVDDVVAVSRTPMAPTTGRASERLGSRRWLIGIAAAILALLLFGFLPWLLEGPDMGPVVTTPDSPTTTALPSTSMTTALETAGTTIDQITIDVVASVVPGLGTLRWERITGNEDSLPMLAHVERDPSGGFISHEGAKLWHSEDGLTWTSEDLVPELSGYQFVFVQDGWAVGSNGWDGPLGVYRKAGDSFVRAELEPPHLPDLPGLGWHQTSRLPLESAGITLIPGPAWAEVPWGEIYGLFEVDCGPRVEQCTQGPGSRWDEPSETLRIHHPQTGSVMAVLATAVLGDTVTFTDAATGATVHTISGTARFTADRIAGHVKYGSELAHMGGWVSNQDGAFAWVDFPWSTGVVHAVHDGGFAAFELVWDWHPSGDTPPTPLVSAAVWTSPDGVEWTNRGEPPFADNAAQHIWIKEGLHEMWATVVTGFEGTDNVGGREVTADWTSTDGVTWTQVATPIPLLYSREFETDFGFVVTAMPQSKHQIWVSTDRSTWYRVEGPPGSHEPDGAGYAASAAAANAIFVTIGDDETGTRTLWIGRFDSSP